MLCYRSLFHVAPRRMMASSASSGNGGGGKVPKTQREIWQDEQSKAKEALAKSNQQHHRSDDPNDDPFGGQTKVNYNHDGVGFKQASVTKDTFLNPLLTPPPRSPKTPEDFAYPARLGHWLSTGFDWTNPVRDKYLYHEFLFFVMFGIIVGGWAFYYSPDMRLSSWARREAFLRTAKREALGLPLIDRNLIDPERIVLPTEEELEDFPVSM